MILCSRNSVEYLQQSLYNLVWRLWWRQEMALWTRNQIPEPYTILGQEKEPTRTESKKKTKIKWQHSYQKSKPEVKRASYPNMPILDGVIPRSYSTENSFFHTHKSRSECEAWGLTLNPSSNIYLCVPLGKWFNPQGDLSFLSYENGHTHTHSILSQYCYDLQKYYIKNY